MSIKIKYVPGKTLATCYFVANEIDENGKENTEKEPAVIRATHLLDPKLHTQANDDNDPNSAATPVQPEQIVEELSKAADDLDTFKQVAYNMAANIAQASIAVKAADEGPSSATEPVDQVKIADKPEVAAEAQFNADETPTESGSEVPKYFGRLPKRTPAAPQLSLDLQSQIQALTEQVKVLGEEKEKVEGERDEAKDKLDSKVKEGEADKVIELLADIGIIEDDKDREGYKKKLTGLSEAQLGVFEAILKDVLEVSGEGAAPKKPVGPTAPKMPGKAPEAPKGPVFSSEDNVFHASLAEEPMVDDMNRLSEISKRWMREDRKKELSNA